jgi:hypothetical protein
VSKPELTTRGTDSKHGRYELLVSDSRRIRSENGVWSRVALDTRRDPRSARRS